MKLPSSRLALVAAVAACLPGVAGATNGYFQHGYGIKAEGMAGAGIALPQDGLAPATNPAGIAFVGDRADLGLTWFKPTRGATIKGSPAPINGDYDGSDKSNFFIPEFGLVRQAGPALAWGVAVYGNGGMNTSYTTPVPLFGSSKAGVDLNQLFVTPAVAWKLAPDHAIGLGLNLAWQRFEATGLENFTGTTPPQRFSLHPDRVTNQGYDDSFGWGLRLGYTGRVAPNVTIGATYQTRTRMQEFEQYKGLFAEEGGFDIPASYGVGIAVQASPALTVALDWMRIEYSGVRSIANPLLPNLFGAPLGAAGGAGFGWQDVSAWKLGVAWAASPSLTLRAGYNRGDQPIPASETLFNILAPGTVKSHWTAGATSVLAGGSELSFSLMYAPRVTVTGAPGSIPAPFGGGTVDLRLKELSVGVGFGWKL